MRRAAKPMLTGSFVFLALLLRCFGPACRQYSAQMAITINPQDRLTLWNPGIPGGIPARTSVCATIDAGAYGGGASDATAGIQAALHACPEGQLVALSARTFRIPRRLQISKGSVLRGLGPEQTQI